MKKITLILFLSYLLSSCWQEPVVEPEPEILNNCTIETKIYYCPIYFCAEKQDIENQVVELYRNMNNALEGENPIQTSTTNENGWLKFYDLNCYEEYVIRIDLEENGIYLANNIFFNSNLSLDVPIIKNMAYDYNNWIQPITEYVNLKYPAVNQYSEYRYFHKPNSLNFSVNDDYDNSVALQVFIQNQISENEYLIGESLDGANFSIDNTHFSGIDRYQESIWRFENDSIYIRDNGNDSDSFISFIWNLRSDDEFGGDEFAIPLKTDSEHRLDMNQVFEFPIPEWTGIGTCEDYTIFGHPFINLLVEKRNLREEDGPLKYNIYSEEYGIVRSVQFLDEGDDTTSGFDIFGIN